MYGTDEKCLENLIGRIFLFTTMSIPALGPPWPPIQWVPGVLSQKVKQLGYEDDYTPLVLRSRTRGSIAPLPNTPS
jgi:hypothetical protein